MASSHPSPPPPRTEHCLSQFLSSPYPTLRCGAAVQFCTKHTALEKKNSFPPFPCLYMHCRIPSPSGADPPVHFTPTPAHTHHSSPLPLYCHSAGSSTFILFPVSTECSPKKQDTTPPPSHSALPNSPLPVIPPVSSPSSRVYERTHVLKTRNGMLAFFPCTVHNNTQPQPPYFLPPPPPATITPCIPLSLSL